MVVMVTYDLNASGQNYKELIEAIKECGITWCKYWTSTYLMKTNLTPSQIVDKLKPYIDSNDRLIVIEVKNNYSGWLTDEQWKYIRENIFG